MMKPSKFKQNQFQIVIVEDDDIDRMSIKRAWDKKDSCEASYMSDGTELFACLDSLDENFLPDLIILDLYMPVMDGREILDKLKADKIYKTIPVVIFTISEKPSDIKICYEKGCYSYIIKPSNTDELSNIVEQMWQFLYKISLLETDNIESSEDNFEFKVKPRVLVVEEEKKAKVIVNNLLSLGYRTSIAIDTEVAINLIEQIKYDIILMDRKNAEIVQEKFSKKSSKLPPIVTLPNEHNLESKVDFADLLNKYL